MTNNLIVSLDPQVFALLERAVIALQQIAGIESASVQPAKKKVRRSSRRASSRDSQAVRLEELWRRLGRANREFLLHLVIKFGDDQEFTLEEAEDDWPESVASLRARMRNIGRATTAMGDATPSLFVRDWDNDEGVMRYSIDGDTRRTIMGLAAKDAKS